MVPTDLSAQISTQSAHKCGFQPHAPNAFPPNEILLVLISFKGRVDPRAIVPPKENRNRNLPACSAVSQQAALSRVAR
jgi:hypothetical protein